MARDPNHEVRLGYEASLGTQLGSLFAELWQELVWLHTVWEEYRVIFGTAPEKLAVANKAAGTFFYIIQSSLLEGVLLNLARLTDPPTSTPMKKRNLTVTALHELVKSELQDAIAVRIQTALDATAFARDWRNRRIAHKDLPLALGDQTAPPLQPASRAAIEEALTALDELMNSVDHNYNDTRTMFKSIEPYDGAERLLGLLEKGLEAEAAEQRERRKKWGLES